MFERIKFEWKNIWCHKLKIDIGLKIRIPLTQRVKYHLLGFTTEDYHNFNLSQNDYHDYISYRERLRLEHVNYPNFWGNLLGKKLIFERIWGRFIKVPHINCWINKGLCVDLESGNEINIASLVRVKGTLIAKPTASVGGGKSVHKLCYKDEQLTIDGTVLSEDDFISTVRSWEWSIVCDCVSQADYSAAIYPASTNSIRVVTVKRKNGKYEVVLAFHRFGTHQSAPVDNISSGGLVSYVDIDSGILSEAKCKITPQKGYSRHPDTNQQIEGIAIPYWQELKDKLIAVHRRFPFYTFFAWDVVINKNNETEILEINRGCDLTGVQMIRPLRKEKLGEFMKEYSLLDR